MKQVLLALAVLGSGSVWAQTLAVNDPTAPMAFASASIKPSDGEGPTGFRPTPGRFRSTNQSLLAVIRYAYDLRDFQIQGGPDWIRNDRYDVNAVTAPGVRVAREMIQRLLAERLALRVRTQTRQLPIYALVRSRPGGPLGPGLVPSRNPCVPGQTDFPPCNMDIRQDRVVTVGTRWTPEFLAGQIIGTVNRMVVDRTGLEGRFDINLRWTPDVSIGANPPPGDERVSLFTALQEQLGLRLQPDTGPVDVLIIDSVSRPTPD